jgi:hypothetical protein
MNSFSVSASLGLTILRKFLASAWSRYRSAWTSLSVSAFYWAVRSMPSSK